MRTFKEFVDQWLDESVSVEGHHAYQLTHGKKPSGRGNWMFSPHKSVDFSKHKEGSDYMSHNGLYSDAKSAAQKWAKTQGHSTIHVQS